jgi:hypothetical protein
MTDMLIAGVDGVVGITWMTRRTKSTGKVKHYSYYPAIETLDILPSLKGEDSLRRLACVLRVRFDGFLLHRGAVLRSVSTGFTSGLSFPRRVSRLARRVVNQDNCKINSNRLPQPKC